jgi:hypothetical protein
MDGFTGMEENAYHVVLGVVQMPRSSAVMAVASTMLSHFPY